jgi:hypothetical protein
MSIFQIDQILPKSSLEWEMDYYIAKCYGSMPKSMGKCPRSKLHRYDASWFLDAVGDPRESTVRSLRDNNPSLHSGVPGRAKSPP